MYGADIGTLNVYQVPSGQLSARDSPKWSRSYDMGAGWRKAVVNLDILGNYQVQNFVKLVREKGIGFGLVF